VSLFTSLTSALLMFWLIQIRWASHQYLIPAQNLSYDEQMMAFRGKSIHKVKAQHKPIKEGYQMWALCDAGYVIDFLFHSLTKVFG
jgi:hypothetical protein